MAKAVLTHKVGSRYDDAPEERYHFPATYRRMVEAAVGDWILYYEPRRTEGESAGGRSAYFAIARVETLQQDPAAADHYYAIIEKGSYLDLERAVPFKENDLYYERALRKADGSTNRGAAGRAVRALSDAEFDAILKSGFTRDADLLAPTELTGLQDEGAVFERPLVEVVASRRFRDGAFARQVKSAYADTCAMTGLKIINGGGRSEVQAAHIRPVAANGPDTVRNGLALCGTAHWMFDRGLISIEDDLSILIAKDRLPDTASRLLNPRGRVVAPHLPALRPDRRFLRYHRMNVFKG